MSPSLSRRELLRSAVLIPAAGALAACATPGGPAPTGAVATPGATSAANPLGIAEDRPFELVIFDGGLGDTYFTDIHRPVFATRHPKVQIRHTATKEITKTLQPRFAAGTPPEVVHNSGANAMDLGALAQDGQLYDLSALLDAPSWDDPAVKVRDTLSPSAVEIGEYDGKFAVLPYTQGVYGIWYSRKVFADNGWKAAPRTWAEFLALCETIKKSGRMAAFTYAGKHPGYIYDCVLTHAAKIGGPDVLKNVDNLQDGAWSQEALTTSAAAWAEVGAKYLMTGTAGLDHVQTQTAQNRYKVAMLPCGVWLENEQKGSTPEGFDYAVFPLPDLTGSDAMPYGTIYARPGENFFVSARSANPLGGVELLRAMLSKQAAGTFVDLVKVPSVVKGAAEGLKLTPGLTSATEMLTAAGTNTVLFRMREWYLPMHDELAAATGQLMNGGLTVAQWAERMNKKAADIKSDSSVKKYTRA
jgi:N-acetylglucosamine transport system substrate-binding protein